MRQFNCVQCGSQIEVPQNYLQPFIKCAECGSHEKIPFANQQDLKYKILDDKERIRLEQRKSQASVPAEETPEEEPVQPEEKAASGPKIAAPAIATRKSAAGWPSLPQDYRSSRKPLDTKRFLIDALGEDGFNLVLEMVAGYLFESDESRKRAKKARVIQTLMKSKITGNLATQTVSYAEKCPETLDYLWANHLSNLKLGLGIFGAGLVISIFIHIIANPGRGFVLFQLPFAVGFAYAINAGINLAALKFEILRSDKVHYLFMTLATLLISLYVVWGLYF